MRYLNSLSSKIARRKRREHGLSLVELLVAMIIFAVIAAATVSIIVMLNNSAAKFQTTTTTQNELNLAMNQIQRDISQANSITVATKYSVGLGSIQKDTNYKTYIFYYDGTSNNVPDGASTANLPRSTPARGSIIEQVFIGTNLQTQTILVGSYQPPSAWNSFFQYYTGNGTQLGSSGNALTSTQLAQVSQIQFSLQSKVSDRTTPVELSSAATLNAYESGLTCNNCNPPIPAAPSLHGQLNYASTTSDGTVTAHLWWNQPGGADSYTIYRTHGSSTIVVGSILDPTVTTYDDSNNLVYGETYTYYIVANGASGLSAQSNLVNLTVRPPQATVVNINTLPSGSNQDNAAAALSKVKADNSAETGTTNPYGGVKYTVAKDLTNQISWAPDNGAVGYYIYRNGVYLATVNGINNTTYQDVSSASNLNVYYGLTNAYYVIAYNVGENGSGGNSVLSNAANLISPPTAPTIGGTAYAQTTGNPYNTINVTADGINSYGNHLYYNTEGTGSPALPSCTPASETYAGSGNDMSLGGSTQHSVNFGTATCYIARAYNDAGESPDSTSINLETYPGAFDITNINTKANLTDTNNGYKYTVARGLTNQISWTQSAGAGGYYVYRGNTRIGTVQGGSNTSFQDTDSNYVQYGATNTYHIVAYATWGSDELDTQSTSSVTLVSPPLAPTISGSAYGSTSGNPYNTLTLTGTVPNANGYYLYRNTSTSNVGDCTATSNTGQDFGTQQGNQLNNSVSWGSSSCYIAIPYNDAGTGPQSNGVTLFVGPSAFAITNINPNGNIDGGTTVARGYTNEVAWTPASGADSYTTYRSGSSIGSTGNLYSTDSNRVAGETETYTASATSSWSGTNYTITVNSNNSAYLQSPPLPSTLSTVANDANNGNSTNSTNTVTLASMPGSSYSDSVQVYGSDSLSASTNCSIASVVGSVSNPSTGNNVTDTVGWGTSSCYYAINHNAAGYGPSGAQNTNANQKPGGIMFNTLTNYTQYMDIYSTYTGPTSNCSGNHGPVDYCYNGGNSNSVSAEQTGNSNITQSGVTYREVTVPLQFNLNWGRDQSNNNVYGVATSGTAYKLSYATNVCGNTLNTPSTVNISASSGLSSYAETNLTPGCVYTATVTVYANNGLSRPTSSAFATSPDVPNAARNYILLLNTAEYGRRLQKTDLTTNHGYHGGASSSINIYQDMKWTSGDSSGAEWQRSDAINTGSTQNLWTQQAAAATGGDGGKLNSQSLVQTQETFTNYVTLTVNSLVLNFQGSINTDGSGSSAANWGTQDNPNPDTFYPNSSYTQGYYPRYFSVN